MWFILNLGDKMKTNYLEVDVPAHILLALNQTKEELVARMKRCTAVNLYNSLKLSLEQAAEFADMTKWEFEDFLSGNKVPISHIDTDDFDKELEIISSL